MTTPLTAEHEASLKRSLALYRAARKRNMAKARAGYDARTMDAATVRELVARARNWQRFVILTLRELASYRAMTAAWYLARMEGES